MIYPRCPCVPRMTCVQESDTPRDHIPGTRPYSIEVGLHSNRRINMPTTHMYLLCTRFAYDRSYIYTTGNRQVHNGKLEEVCHRDGNTYVAMPLLWVSLCDQCFSSKIISYTRTRLMCSCDKRALSCVAKLLPNSTHAVRNLPCGLGRCFVPTSIIPVSGTCGASHCCTRCIRQVPGACYAPDIRYWFRFVCVYRATAVPWYKCSNRV